MFLESKKVRSKKQEICIDHWALSIDHWAFSLFNQTILHSSFFILHFLHSSFSTFFNFQFPNFELHEVYGRSTGGLWEVYGRSYGRSWKIQLIDNKIFSYKYGRSLQKQENSVLGLQTLSLSSLNTMFTALKCVVWSKKVRGIR